MTPLSSAELKRMLAGSSGELVMVNTLPTEDFGETRIPNSVNVPEDRDDFADRVAELLGHNKNRTVVVYCASRQCDSASRAARKLEAAGFTNVFDYEGGAEEWQESGEELATARGR